MNEPEIIATRVKLEPTETGACGWRAETENGDPIAKGVADSHGKAATEGLIAIADYEKSLERRQAASSEISHNNLEET